jgi:3D (Asp-Asp-Asp) domain-containing protein
MALKGSKCTQYKEGEGGYKDALGNRLDSSKCNTVASHNLPYGTKVYIPAFKNKQSVNPSCIFTVTDTGNAGFDFDICCSPSVWSGSTRLDVYVTEWGTGKAAVSHTYAYKNFTVYESLWKDYVKNGGTTYKVTKFNNDDANITQQDFWKKYS